MTTAQNLFIIWWKEKYGDKPLPEKLTSEQAEEHYKWLAK